MSKTQDKRKQRRNEQAEFLWERAQLRAALMKQVLDVAIAEWEEHKDEIPDEINKQTQEQIDARKKQLEEFLMEEKDKYLAAIGASEDK